MHNKMWGLVKIICDHPIRTDTKVKIICDHPIRTDTKER